MAQFGLHVLAGLSVTRFVTKGPGEHQMKMGLVIGNVLPDADYFLLGAFYLFDSDLALSMHRSWSHSLVVQGFLILLLAAVWARSSRERRRGLVGLWIGMAMHSLLDLVLWFSAVDLFWPLGLAGIPSSVFLWSSLPPPPWLSNLLGAGEFFCFSLMFSVLGRHAVRQDSSKALLLRLRRLQYVVVTFFVLFACLSFLLSHVPSYFNVLLYALLILVFFPIGFWIVLRMKETVVRV